MLRRLYVAIFLVFGAGYVSAHPTSQKQWWTVSATLHELEKPAGIAGLPKRFDICTTPRDKTDDRKALARLIDANRDAPLLRINQQFTKSIPLRYRGLGLTFIPVAESQDSFLIVGALPNSSAGRMDFFHSDMVLLSVDGVETRGKSDDEVLRLLNPGRSTQYGVTIEVQKQTGGRTYTRFVQSGPIATNVTVQCLTLSR